MELTHLNQIDYNELRFEKIDCLIASCGGQARCHHLAGKIHTQVPRKILIMQDLPEHKQKGSRYREVFSGFGFSQYVLAGGSESHGLAKLFEEICNVRTHQLNIVVDYSCMPKKWYAQLIDTITRSSYIAARINLFLSYTPKVFEKKSGKTPIDYIGPILFNRDNLKDKKPVSVIASLDNHHNTLLEAIGKIKPQKLLAFIPHCKHDPDYTHQVLENNKSILDRLDDNSIINYDADNPEEIDTLITSHCLDQRIAAEVMILPQGPKTFSLMSMLLSVRYPDVKLWEIIPRDNLSGTDQGLPAGNPVIVKASFVNDEDQEDE